MYHYYHIWCLDTEQLIAKWIGWSEMRTYKDSGRNVEIIVAKF